MRIGLFGYGKMGKVIEKTAMERGHSIVWKIDSSNKASVLQAPEFKTADVVIEFTQPEYAEEHIQTCLSNQLPVVCGTTGWYKNLDKIKSAVAAAEGTFFYASNFSLGVNIFFAVNQFLAKIMDQHPDYKMKIQEIHHTQKLDAPSGTAISTAEQIIANHKSYEKWELGTESKLGVVPIEALRVENVPGTHTVRYESEIDEIILHHIAKNRLGFALGAVMAAEWVHDKKGVYTMADMLDLNF